MPQHKLFRMINYLDTDYQIMPSKFTDNQVTDHHIMPSKLTDHQVIALKTYPAFSTLVKVSHTLVEWT